MAKTKQMAVRIPVDLHKTYLVHALVKRDMTFTEFTLEALRNQYIKDIENERANTRLQK